MDGIQEAGLLCFLKPFSETRMMPIMILVLIVLCAGENFAADKDLTMPDINLVLEQSEKTSLKMKIPDNQYNQLGKDAAEELTSQFQSPEYQGEICQEQQRLRQEVFKDVLALVAPNDPESRQQAGGSARRHVIQAHHPRRWAQAVEAVYHVCLEHSQGGRTSRQEGSMGD